jgi:hypothetical protein
MSAIKSTVFISIQASNYISADNLRKNYIIEFQFVTPLLQLHSRQATRETCGERYGDCDSKWNEKWVENSAVANIFRSFNHRGSVLSNFMLLWVETDIYIYIYILLTTDLWLVRCWLKVSVLQSFVYTWFRFPLLEALLIKNALQKCTADSITTLIVVNCWLSLWLFKHTNYLHYLYRLKQYTGRQWWMAWRLCLFYKSSSEFNTPFSGSILSAQPTATKIEVIPTVCRSLNPWPHKCACCYC